MKLLYLLALVAPSLGQTKDNDPDWLPPPPLEENIPLPKSSGRGLASIEEEEPKPAIKVPTHALKPAATQGKCPKGYRVVDFHGWMCGKK